MKSMYKVLDQSPCAVLPHGSIWNPYVPSRVDLFAWETSWDKVLTLDQLKRSGRRALTNRCFLCEEKEEEEEETADHLLLHCTRTRSLWELFISIVRISWVSFHTDWKTFLAWQQVHVSKKRKKV